MRRRFSVLGVLALVSWGCSFEQTTSEERHRRLADEDGDGLMEETDPGDDGTIIMPDPGDCPILEYTEIHTVTTDADGNVISESWEVCVQCFDEAGTALGDRECYDEPPLPPEVYCEEYESDDPTLACYYCVTADGEVVIDECYPLPVECTTDADCPEGQICYVWDTGYEDPSGGDGMAPTPGGGGWCGYPDPCVHVDTLPEDPTGESCWICTDPVTGESWGAWCDFHRCGDDGSCVNPWEICDPAGSGYCVYDDPCDPVPSLPEDPTGSDCYRCVDPATGEDWGGWCNVHSCTTDADCAERMEICNEDTGFCEYDDPCDPVESLPGDPTGYDCYQCIDPATGDDWGGWCNFHACETDGDCTLHGFGDRCDGSVCVWDWGCDGSGGMP